MADEERAGSEEYRELAELLEGRLAKAGPDEAAETDEVRLRLVRLYLETLRDPQRAALHSETLLKRDRVSSEALDAASALLEEPGVAARMAELVSGAYARVGSFANEAATLARELKLAAPPRLERVQRRLAELRYRELDDPEGALELLEPLVAERPADDELRRVYIEIAAATDRRLPAAKVLSRALKAVKDDEDRARIGLDLGTLFLQQGELSHARAALTKVVHGKASGAAVLAAARQLVELEPEPGDPALVGPALMVIVRAAPDPTDRHRAATRLLRHHETKPLDEARLAEVYSALRTEDPAEARALALRRIRALSADPDKVEQTILGYSAFLSQFGGTPGDVAELVAFLEQHERLQELAEHCPDASLRLAALATWADAAAEQDVDPERGLAVCELALKEAVDQAPASVEEWLVRLERCTRESGRPEAEARVLLDALGDRPIDSKERSAIAGAAIAALSAAELADDALSLCRRMLEVDPSAPDLLRRLDELLGELEPKEERLARYETALAQAREPERRRSLMHAMLAIRWEVLRDVPGTSELLGRLLAEHPSDLDAHSALLEINAESSDTDTVLTAIDRALAGSEGRARHVLILRKAITLTQSGQASAGLELCRGLLAEPNLDTEIIESIADTAHDEDDPDLYRQALELVADSGEADARKRALERLGDFQFQRGNPEAAVESWRPAAELCETGSGEEERARQLYERVLEAMPDDSGAARHLVELYARLDEWVKVPEAFSVLIRSEAERSGAVELLLGLQQGAVNAGAVGEFVSMVDEAMWRLGPDSSKEAVSLKRARAKALASDPAHEEQASRAYRDLVESFKSEEDISAFQAFFESRPSADDRHQDRRWLYEWRARHSASPLEVLRDWAMAEEQQGDLEAAVAVYERLSAADPGGIDWPEALCRLKLATGDFEGGLLALRALSKIGEESARRAAELGIARLLLHELGRPIEAIDALAPLLAARPASAEAHEMAAQILGDEALRNEAADRLEQIANAMSEPPSAAIYTLLVNAFEPSEIAPERRGPWFERLVELSLSDPPTALPAAVRGAREVPERISLWAAAERLAPGLGQSALVSTAYHQVLAEKHMQPELAEALGRRMVAFHDECSTDPEQLVDALGRVLMLVPGARWALDRVKLALSSQARWEELLALYDRAIAAAPNAGEQADLLDEAVLAAKDLAGDAERAIHYLGKLHRLRPDDAIVSATLERLYERNGHTHELLELLAEHLSTATGAKRQELRRRTAALWLELDRPDEAEAEVERMLDDGSSIADAMELLERVAQHSVNRDIGQPPTLELMQHARQRAIELLSGLYQELGQSDDLIRIGEIELSLGKDARQRARAMRKLLRLHLTVRAEAAEPFGRAFPRVEAEVSGDAKLAKIAYETLLIRAIRTLRQVGVESSGARREAAHDASSAILRAVDALKSLLLNEGKPRRAVRLLWHSSRVLSEQHQRRELLGDAAALCLEQLGDDELALRIFRELFAGDAGDAVAAKWAERFAGLLASKERHDELAELWEQRARSAAVRGDASDERADWERAAALWERLQISDRAIDAHRRGALLGSEMSLESLCNIHAARGEWREATEALELLYSRASGGQRAQIALRLADAYEKLGKRDVARARLEDALATASDLDSVRERLLAVYREDSMIRPLARLLAEQARRLDDPQAKLALLREASELLILKLDDASEAVPLLEHALQIAPLDLELCFRLTDALIGLERWQDAVRILRAHTESYGAQRSKERARAHHRLAGVLLRSERSAEALAELKLAAEMHRSDRAILHDLGRVALAQDDLESAEAAFRALVLALHHPIENLAELPNRAEVYLDLSEITARRGDPERAADLIESAFDAALARGDDPVRFERALRARGRFDLLERALRGRVESAAPLPKRATALGELAELWAEQLGRSPELEKHIVRQGDLLLDALEREASTDVDAWTALGLVETLLGDRDRLVILLESAISKVSPEAGSRLRVLLAKNLILDPARSAAAISVLSTVLEEDPDDNEAAELLTNALEREGRLDVLASVLARRLEQLGGASSNAGLGLRLGQVLEQVERAPEALSIYESVVDGRPGDRDTLQTLAERMATLGSDRLADCLEQLASLDPEAVPALARKLLELREREGDPAAVTRALELGFSVDPNDGMFRDRLLQLHEEKGNFSEAARVLSRALEVSPGDRSLVRRLIEVHRKSGEDRQALHVIDTALAARPRDAELLGTRANVRQALGDDEGALSDIESAGAVNPRHAEAHVELLKRIGERATPSLSDKDTLRLVDLLLRVKQTDVARTALERLLDRSPNHPQGLQRIAALAVAEGNWQAAIRDFRSLLGVFGSDPAELASVALALADVCDRAGCANDAREPLERALEVTPGNVELTRKLEELYVATADSTRLANLLVVRAEHEAEAAAKLGLLLRAGNLLVEVSELPRALEVVELARAADPESSEASLLTAKVQLSSGRPAEAIGVLKQVLHTLRGNRSPLTASIQLELGRAHLALDEIFEAFDALKSGYGMDRKNSQLSFLFGLVALDLEDEKTADRALQSLTTLQTQDDTATPPIDPEAKAIAFYHLAALALGKGDMGRARRLANKAVAEDPGNVEARALLDELASGQTATVAAATR